MDERKYDTDLTDEQWNLIRRLLPPPSNVGAPRQIDRRQIINAILYINRTGCQWRMLPKDFPNWSTVYGLFWQWRIDGTWKTIHDRLREKVRVLVGKKATPSAAVIDSQSVPTTEVGGEERGYDGGKKIKGRKRHLAVDTLGMIIAVVVHSGHWQDYEGAHFVLMKLRHGFHRLKVIFADSAYGKNGLPDWVSETLGWVLQTVLRPVQAKGFVVLPKRWIVERTFGWLGRCRRHSKDYERNPESSEAMIYVSMIHLMLRRLAPANP